MRIIDADLNDAVHRAAVVEMVDGYSRMAIGAGKPLSGEVRARLADGLRDAGAIVLLAEEGGRFIGIAACLRSYSTFAGKPVVNVHDLAVMNDAQGRGVGGALLAAVEQRAAEMGCGKVTLEVRSDNSAARRLYGKRGYRGADLAADPAATLFCEKAL